MIPTKLRTGIDGICKPAKHQVLVLHSEYVHFVKIVGTVVLHLTDVFLGTLERSEGST